MRDVIVSPLVMDKISELRRYLIEELKMSREAAHRRTDRIDNFLLSLSAPADYALCRFERWRVMGYRCAAFEGWVFAYEAFDEGVVIRDMSHGKQLVA